MPSTLPLLILGALTGLVGAMLGLGGGVFLVPLLTLAMGVPIRTAIAASLLSVIATASASAVVRLGKGLVNMRLGLVLEVATTLGGLAGGITAAYLTHRQLFVIFGITLLVMGGLMVRRSGKRNILPEGTADPGQLGGVIEEDGDRFVYRVRRLPLALGASGVAGAISGLLGLGGGIVKVPILNTFCGIPIRVAASTSTFMIGVTAAASVSSYFARGDVVLPVAAAICLGAVPGSLVGARLSEHMPPRFLKVTMAIVLLVVGARMAMEALL